MSDLTVRWGILGPGGIATEFLRGAANSATGKVTALGTRNPDRPDLAERFPGMTIHPSYEALLADPEVDAIYIATPTPFTPNGPSRQRRPASMSCAKSRRR